MSFRLPKNTERLTINGRTGSGKTVFGAFVLSEAAFDKQPYIILDFKGDELLNSIHRAEEIALEDKLPNKPGLFYTKPNPARQQDIESWLWKIWAKTKIGLFVDEGYMVPYQKRDASAFKTILSQGRSLRVPVITLTQRPVACNRSVFTEADFYASFDLNDVRDQKTVAAFTPDDPVWDFENKVKPHHARWYDVKAAESYILSPCPTPDQILERFDERLRPKKRFI